jgi:hypothetical protein
MSHLTGPSLEVRRGSPTGLQHLTDITGTTLHKAQVKWKELFSRHNTHKTKVVSEIRPASAETVMTTGNRRGNNYWGDELQAKPPHITRIYSQNVHGLTLDRRGGQFEDVCKVHNEVQADIFLGQEHNLDTTQFHVRSSLYDAAKQHCVRARLAFGTSPISFNTHCSKIFQDIIVIRSMNLNTTYTFAMLPDQINRRKVAVLGYIHSIFYHDFKQFVGEKGFNEIAFLQKKSLPSNICIE